MKVSELEGVKLDYWVAQANILNGGHWKDMELRPYRADCWTLYDRSEDMVFGWITENILDSIKLRQELNLGHAGLHFWPSVDWQHGGPIIESERIRLNHRGAGIPWAAQMFPGNPGFPVYGYGETPLIAAMRAYVASKYGEEVPDE